MVNCFFKLKGHIFNRLKGRDIWNLLKPGVYGYNRALEQNENTQSVIFKNTDVNQSAKQFAERKTEVVFFLHTFKT